MLLYPCTVTVVSKVPRVVGVPVIVPVDPLMESPLGRPVALKAL